MRIRTKVGPCPEFSQAWGGVWAGKVGVSTSQPESEAELPTRSFHGVCAGSIFSSGCKMHATFLHHCTISPSSIPFTRFPTPPLQPSTSHIRHDTFLSCRDYLVPRQTFSHAPRMRAGTRPHHSETG